MRTRPIGTFLTLAVAALALPAVATAQSNADLQDLALSAGTLIPAFEGGTFSYAADVPYATAAVTVTPVAADPNATITVNGVPVISGAPSGDISLSVGGNAIAIVVTAQDGVTTLTYELAVTRVALGSDANLAGLAPSAGELSPAFDSGAFSYTVAVAYATATITVTPAAADANATITVNGETVASGSPSGDINLSVGDNAIAIVVTAEDGVTIQTYTLAVTRAAPGTDARLAGLALSAGALTPAFDGGAFSYTAGVSHATATMTVTPAAADANATITVNGNSVASGTPSGDIILGVGGNVIAIVVTAEDGVTSRTYTLAVTRAARLTWDANNTGAGRTDGAGAWLGPNQWWDGSANATWNNGALDEAIIGVGGAGGTITLGAVAAGSLTFNSFAGAYTLAGGSLTLNSGLALNAGAGAVTLGSPIALGGAQNWTNSSGSLLTVGTGPVTTGGYPLTIRGSGDTAITGVISGAGGLTKAGAGALTLAASNTFSGAMTVIAGMLRLTDPGALASSSGLTLASGATLALRSDRSAAFITPAMPVGAYANTTIDVNHNGSGSGHTLTLSGGIEVNNPAANRTVNITGGNGYVLGIPTVACTNVSGLNGAVLAFNPTTAAVSLGTVTVNCNGRDIQINLDGTSANNSVTTIDDISAGDDQLSLQKLGAGTWALGNAACRNHLRINAGGLIANGTLTIGRTGGSGVKTRDLQLNGGVLHYNNPAAARFIAGTDPAGRILMQGGNLDNSSGAAIRTSTYDPAQTWSSNFTFIGSLGANSDLYLGAGTVGLAATPAVTVSNALTTLTVGGAITGAYGIVKSGPGTLQLAGTNTYSGVTTVSNGTLRLGARNALDADNNVVLAGGALDMGGYSNRLGRLAVTGAATLVLGSGSIGFLDSSGVAWPGTLALKGWLGRRAVRFGAGPAALTPGQLAKITLGGQAVSIDADGYLTAAAGGAAVIVR